MRLHLLWSACVLAAASTVCGLALADVPPPPDYVEQCTVAKQQKPGMTCEACRAWVSERERCVQTLGQQGYAMACRTRGASAWEEIWCKSGSASGDSKAAPTTFATPPPSDPNQPNPVVASDPNPAPVNAPAPSPPKSGCASCAVGAYHTSAAMGLLAVAAGVVGLLLRRKPQR